MEFEKIFNIFVGVVIVVLLLTTLVSLCFVIVNKANGNLGAVTGNIGLVSCTQLLQ